MVNRPAFWFRGVGGIALVVSLLAIWAMEELQHAHLVWWQHIPLTVVMLTLIGGGPLLFGITLVEGESRESKTLGD